MATQTTNLNLVKPDYTDAADIAVINTNMDTIDSNVHGNAVDIAGIATIITGTTNNSGHSVSSGEYFIANGAKYKATATIGTGVTWADKSSSISDHDLINSLNSNLMTITKWDCQSNENWSANSWSHISGGSIPSNKIPSGKTVSANLIGIFAVTTVSGWTRIVANLRSDADNNIALSIYSNVVGNTNSIKFKALWL